MRCLHVVLLLTLSGLSACEEASEEQPVDPCQVDAQVSAPETIAQVVDLINALPKPLELGCFLRSLQRPLYLDTSTGFISAQPGPFERSPRILIVRDELVLSVVPEGDGKTLLEMSELDASSQRSLKGEVKFPILSAIGPMKPYEDIMLFGSLSSCGFCHLEEQPHPSIPGAFVSRALRPIEFDRVPLETLRAHANTCDAVAEPYRCAVLEGIFGQGEVFDGALPDDVPTIE